MFVATHKCRCGNAFGRICLSCKCCNQSTAAEQKTAQRAEKSPHREGSGEQASQKNEGAGGHIWRAGAEQTAG